MPKYFSLELWYATGITLLVSCIFILIYYQFDPEYQLKGVNGVFRLVAIFFDQDDSIIDTVR